MSAMMYDDIIRPRLEKIGNWKPKKEKKKSLDFDLTWTHLVVCPFLSNHY